jgi:hypothetical protein
LRLLTKSGAGIGFWGGVEEGIPQGLKPRVFIALERPKAKALGYLEATATKKLVAD